MGIGYTQLSHKIHQIVTQNIPQVGFFFNFKIIRNKFQGFEKNVEFDLFSRPKSHVVGRPEQVLALNLNLMNLLGLIYG